jgi:cell fate regulator YaaT (PSP1 superfamily)
MTDPMQPSETPPVPPPAEPDAQPPAGQQASPPVQPDQPAVSPPAEPPTESQTRPAQEERRPRMIVRYGLLTTVGEFNYPSNLRFSDGTMLVIQTDRGIEIGQHVPLTPPCHGENAINPRVIRQYVEQSGTEYLQPRCGRVLRVATEQDLIEQERINEDAAEELKFCQDLVDQHNLPMRLITSEHLFGGERVIFYFMAEGRVDFRDLVRDLARQYQTRIEMRQVGARDEARLAADYEICGRECCCKNFLKTLRPVNMKMAKMQKATLDPSKVSGRCGRLRCCLRYEHECYEDLNRRLPRNNTWVKTPEGEGRVVDRHILSQLVLIQLEDQRHMTFPLDEIEILADRPPVRQEPAEPPAGGGRPARGQSDAPGQGPNRSDRQRQGRGRDARRSSGSPPGRNNQATPAPDAEPEEAPLPGPFDEPEMVDEREPENEPPVAPPAAEAMPPAQACEETSPPQGGEAPANGEQRRPRGRRRRRRSRRGGGGGGAPQGGGTPPGPSA